MSAFDDITIVDNQIVENKWVEWYHYGIHK